MFGLCSFGVACSGDGRKYLTRADAFLSQNNYREAELNYRRAIQQNGHLGEARFGLGRVQFHDNRLLEAHRSFSQAHELLPRNSKVTSMMGDVALAIFAGSGGSSPHWREQTTRTAEELLAADPQSYDGWRLRGYLGLYDANTEASIAAFRRADAIRPLQPDIAYGLTQAMLRAGQEEPAMQYATAFLQKSSSATPLYDIVLKFNMSRRRFADAEAILKLKVSKIPASATVLELARFYIATGNTKSADEQIQRLLRDKNAYPHGYVEAGAFYSQAGQRQKALLVLNDGLKETPADRSDLRRHIAEALAGDGRNAEALAVLAQAAKDDRQNKDIRLLRAKILLVSGEQTAAVAEFRSLAAAQPDNATVQYETGRAYTLIPDLEKAATFLSEAIRLSPEWLAPRLLLAESLMQLGDYPAARRHAEAVLEKDKQNAPAKLLQAVAFRRGGMYNRAEMALKDLLKESPQALEPKIELAALRVEQQRFADAQAILDQVNRPGQNHPKTVRVAADLYLAQNKPSAAIDLINSEMKRNPSTEMRAVLADTAFRSRQWPIAIAQYQQLAGEEKSSAARYLFNQGNAYLQSGKPDAAVAPLREAVQRSPDDPSYSMTLALALQQCGNRAEAKQLYERVLKTTSNQPFVMNNLAYLLVEEGGDLDTAVQLAEGAYRQLAGDARIADTLGMVYLKKGMMEPALNIYRNILEREPGNSVYRYHYARVLAQNRSTSQQAITELETALQSNPATGDAREIREFLSTVRGGRR